MNASLAPCRTVLSWTALLTIPVLLSPRLAAQEDVLVGPGPRPVDQFHPERDKGIPDPAYGGRAILHLESMPKNFNRTVENSAVTRALHHIVHESLVVRDWEDWDLHPRLCASWDTEDMLLLEPAVSSEYESAVAVKVKVSTDEGSKQIDAMALFGKVTETADGFALEAISKGNPNDGITVPADHVQGIERGTVFTFNLRDDAIWQPATGEAGGEAYQISGHPFDARDVYFSWSVYYNPQVDCDEVRFQFEKITRCDIVDERTVRMFYESQYYDAVSSVGIDMQIMPSHLFDLTDPDNPWHDADATLAEQARHVNENPHNQMYIGLGPYQVTEANQTYVECTRYDDYFLREDPRECGYFDVIRYRLIDDDDAAYQALINGELDFFYRIKSTDYFGAATQIPAFTDNLYKGYFYFNSYGYTVWNLYKPQFEDVAVRQAIAHAFDFEEYKRTNYKGLCEQVTGPFAFHSAAYDQGVTPYPYDPDEALTLLEDAGWYDSDGNGIADRDGVELEFEFLMPAGNDASRNFGLKLQESLAEIGIKMDIAEMEWATFLERIKNREHDSANLAWMASLESDPEQIWHSKWGQPGRQSSNNSGLRDPEIDRLIEAGQRELDKETRMGIWHEIHRRIYEAQPYLFMYNVPRKFGINKNIRGFQAFTPRPGYYPRRWYYPEGTPGTRATIDG